MESLIKLVPTFEVRIGENDTISLNVWELTALQLWLLMANKNLEAKPLWLKGKKFVHRKGDLISFEDTYCTLNRSQVIDLINAISNLTGDESTAVYLLNSHYPDSSSWQNDFNTVNVKETMSGSFIGYYREDTGETLLPVVLRWSEDLGTWYGIKGTPNGGVSFYFKDLTIGQI